MAPCILCFDKIDAIAPNKLASTGTSRRTASHAFDRILSTFLMELDGISTDAEVSCFCPLFQHQVNDGFGAP